MSGWRRKLFRVLKFIFGPLGSRGRRYGIFSKNEYFYWMNNQIIFWMNKFLEWIFLILFWMNKFFEWIFSPYNWMNYWMTQKKCAIHKKNEWKVPFLDRTGPFCLFFTVFHCFLKLWFVFKFEWIISLNEYFWFNFEWIILLNEYSRFNFELNHFFARFNVKMNNQNISATPTQSSS